MKKGKRPSEKLVSMPAFSSQCRLHLHRERVDRGLEELVVGSCNADSGQEANDGSERQTLTNRIGHEAQVCSGITTALEVIKKRGNGRMRHVRVGHL